ncbi:hypothetical protein ACFWG6_33670 [Streptomyces erythrochromogenes]|uniref:hypothetical protein n=1 Tax=Streptomyces erythrochromogenes TaxID=285574 RepID=UPI0036261983
MPTGYQTPARSWDGLDELDVVLFRLKGFSFAISKHDGNPVDVSYVWLTEPHERADEALDTLLEVVGIGGDAVAFRGDAHEDPSERTATAHDADSPDEATDVTLPSSLRARFRSAIGRTP